MKLAENLEGVPSSSRGLVRSAELPWVGIAKIINPEGVVSHLGFVLMTFIFYLRLIQLFQSC